jgi:hypothetical protein
MSLIYFLGQDVGLTATPLDDAGSPVAGSVSVAVTVTDPSGATTSPSTATGLYGAYSAVVPAVSLAGIYLVRWTATGTGVSWSFEDQFSVRALGVEQLVDMASVKAHLNMNADDTRQDSELQGFILAAADLARNHCGPFLPETHTEWFDGGTTTIVPDWLPVAKVLSVTEYYGQSAFVLTEQPLGAQSNAFAYTVDYTSGQFTRRVFGGEGGYFAAGSKNIKIVYTAGTGYVPWAVRLGALELIRHLWQLTQQGGRPKFGGGGYDSDVAPVPAGFALPSRVLELWAGARRGPGIA